MLNELTLNTIWKNAMPFGPTRELVKGYRQAVYWKAAAQFAGVVALGSFLLWCF